MLASNLPFWVPYQWPSSPILEKAMWRLAAQGLRARWVRGSLEAASLPGRGHERLLGSRMETHLHGRIMDMPRRIRRTLVNIVAGTGATTCAEVSMHSLPECVVQGFVGLQLSLLPLAPPLAPHLGPAPCAGWKSSWARVRCCS